MGGGGWDGGYNSTHYTIMEAIRADFNEVQKILLLGVSFLGGSSISIIKTVYRNTRGVIFHHFCYKNCLFTKLKLFRLQIYSICQDVHFKIFLYHRKTNNVLVILS